MKGCGGVGDKSRGRWSGATVERLPSYTGPHQGRSVRIGPQPLFRGAHMNPEQARESFFNSEE